jgi:hypothetical protein
MKITPTRETSVFKEDQGERSRKSYSKRIAIMRVLKTQWNGLAQAHNDWDHAKKDEVTMFARRLQVCAKEFEFYVREHANEFEDEEK